MTAAEDARQYEARVLAEAEAWRERQLRRPGLWDMTTRATQDRINKLIPERVHQIVTSGVELTTRGIMAGAEWTTAKPLLHGDLRMREDLIRTRIDLYRTTASAEGGVAGAGGFLLAAADFPALLAIKVKLLAEIGALYGHSGKSLSERLYLLRIFQMAFSSAKHRPEALSALEAAGRGLHQPERIQDFDWRRFQQEYRDYIDLAKLAQLIPVIGAPVGAVVNWRLTTRLATTAMNAYRLRWFEDEHLT